MWQNIKEGIVGHPAKWYSDVFDLVFPGLDKDEANKVWKKQLSSKNKKEDCKDEDSDDD